MLKAVRIEVPQSIHKIDDIYPLELELKRTTDCRTTLSYLDIRISIANRKYFTTVFDKQDSFPFAIVNFPHMTSNIPSKPGCIFRSWYVLVGFVIALYSLRIGTIS